MERTQPDPLKATFRVNATVIAVMNPTSRASRQDWRNRDAVDGSKPRRESDNRGAKASSRLPRQKIREFDTQQPWLEINGAIDESDETIRLRVRQRIQQRVEELQAATGQTGTPVTFGDEERVPDGKNRVIESLHEDVVLTAAQILARYLEKNQRDDSLELTLVHRMLVKEVELQALQRQRGTQKSK